MDRRHRADADHLRVAHTRRARRGHAGTRPSRYHPRQRARVAALPGGARTQARVVGVGLRLHADLDRCVRDPRGIPAERAAEAARAIWAQVRDVRENGVSEGELTRAKRVYEARWVRRLEDMEGQANYLAEWEALGDWTLGDDYLRRALAVTTDEIQMLARRFLDPDQAGVIVYRPKDSAEVARDAASMRVLLDGAPPAVVEPTVPSPVTAPSIVTGLRAEQEEGGVHAFRTEAGIPVLVRRKAGALVHAGVYALGGGRDEAPGHAGLTSLLVRA